MEDDIDPDMQILGRRSYQSWCKVMQREPQEWAALPHQERAAWTQAAVEAGQNFPAPIVVEIAVRGPNSAVGAPTKVTFWGDATAAGTDRIVAQFTAMLKNYVG